ncbi:MAG: MFS transporter [Cellulosilyticaceae bacterium]
MKKDYLKLPLILVSLSFFVMSFLLPIYSVEIGMNATAIGGMFSVVSIIILLLKPVVGRISDKIGRKPLLIGGMALYGVAFYLLASAHTPAMMYTVRVIQGVASALLSMGIYAVAVDLAEGEGIGERLGNFSAAQTTGMIFGMGFAMSYLFRVDFVEGWHRIFCIFALCAMIAAVLTALRVPETRKVNLKKDKAKTLKELPKKAIGLVGVGFVVALFSSMVGPILMIYLQEYVSRDLGLLSYIFFPSALLWCFLPGRLGRVSDKGNKYKIAAIGLGISSIAIGIVPFVEGTTVLAGLWCLDAIGDMLDGPARTALFAKMTGGHATGQNYGVYSTVCGIGGAIGPLLGGMMYDHIGHRIPFYFYGVGLLIAAFMMLILPKQAAQDKEGAASLTEMEE